jgi:hypothetical protein
MSDKNSEDKLKVKNNQDQSNTKSQEEKVNKNGIPKLIVRKISTLSDSIINYFVIGICLFLQSAYNLNWFDMEDNKIKIYIIFIFAAVVLYTIGIFNWYEGKELLFLFDFILSFYFLTIYFKEEYKGKISEKFNTNIISDSDNNKLQAIFYILIFCLFFIIGFSAFKKGIIYIVNYFILFVGFVFLFIDFYWNKNHTWITKVHYYIFIVSGVLMWIIGILKIINQGFLSKDTVILGQTD